MRRPWEEEGGRREPSGREKNLEYGVKVVGEEGLSPKVVGLFNLSFWKSTMEPGGEESPIERTPESEKSKTELVI